MVRRSNRIDIRSIPEGTTTVWSQFSRRDNPFPAFLRSRSRMPPSFRLTPTLSRTIWFSSSGKYPKEVNRERQRSNAAGRRKTRISSRTHSTWTPSLRARARAKSSIFPERSTPVTRCPCRAIGMACLPLPHPRSSTVDPGRKARKARISSTSFSAFPSSGPNSSGYLSSKISSNHAPDIPGAPIPSRPPPAGVLPHAWRSPHRARRRRLRTRPCTHPGSLLRGSFGKRRRRSRRGSPSPG